MSIRIILYDQCLLPILTNRRNLFLLGCDWLFIATSSTIPSSVLPTSTAATAQFMPPEARARAKVRVAALPDFSRSRRRSRSLNVKLEPSATVNLDSCLSSIESVKLEDSNDLDTFAQIPLISASMAAVVSKTDKTDNEPYGYPVDMVSVTLFFSLPAMRTL